jgi:predicted transcriptional regulator
MPAAKARKSHNFHVPLPEDLYRRLRREAERSDIPATEIAREAIRYALRQRQRAAVHEALTDYASSMAGTLADLDHDLEAAGIDELLDVDGTDETP